MRALIAATAGVVAVALPTGCEARTTTLPNAAPSRTPPPPASTPLGPAPLGTTQTSTGSEVTAKVTVYHARTVRSRPDAVTPSRTFYGIDIRVCIPTAPGDVSLSPLPWTLDYADDTQAKPISEWWDGEFAVPLYPAERRVTLGQCLRGWVMFKPLKRRLARISYTPSGAGTLSWRAP
jgi:hypothetical protein